MSDPRYYTADGVAVVAGAALVNWRQQAHGDTGGTRDRIFTGYSDERITFLVDNTGAQSLDFAVYGLMTETMAVADGILVATAATVASGATGHLIVGVVVATANVVNGFPWYAMTVLSASGTTADIKAIVKGAR